MHRQTCSEAGDFPSPRSSRAPSFCSDRPSVAGSVTFQMPSTARPAPAYIAASVASQIVTDHHNAQLQDDVASQSGLPDLTHAVFSEQALSLLNAFLDHLLFAFLSTARSPSLTAIRPAITDVLKPRLAREATATADDELQGLLGGEDEDEFPEHVSDSLEKWDVEKVWKRTRLRIMVYTRLGELEDSDEQRYVEQERGLSMDNSGGDEAGLVSWASAIFLTSVIEYIAEQTLLVSGQASYARMYAKLRKASQASEEGEPHQLERIVVEDFDVEKIALNSALGRLWRTWRKRVRPPLRPLTPAGGPRAVASYSSLQSRKMSYDTIDAVARGQDGVPEIPEHKPTETEIAANIPLPIGDNDVEEIEVPGLAPEIEDGEESSGAQTPVMRPQRPSSVIMPAAAHEIRKKMAKGRPVSMPSPDAQPLTVPAQVENNGVEASDAEDFATPMERPSEDESFIVDEPQEGIHADRDDAGGEPDADMVAFAASTGMGLGMSPVSPTQSSDFENEDMDTIDTPTKTSYPEPQVLHFKRMSIEKPGTPGLVRTFSTRSQRNSPLPTPTLEQTSYLNDAQTDDDLSGSEAIGVARTSNVPIAATQSPPAERPTSEDSMDSAQRKQPDNQGFVELAPRNVTTTAATLPHRKTPSPEDFSRPLPNRAPRQEALREHNVHRRDATPPRTRGSPLTVLPETESWSNQPQESTHQRQKTSDSYRGPLPNGSPRSQKSARARESPVAASERQPKRSGPEISPSSGTSFGEGISAEKSSLKRVSSTSTSRSASTSILNGGRDSDVGSSRPRGFSGRMSQEDREREFDSLVKSEDTVKFTLTPQSMRDIDEPALSRQVEPSRPTAASVTVYPRVNANKENQFGSQPLPARSASRTNGHAGPSTSKPTRKPLAREPRIEAESMRDFADFIRSTGPSPGQERPVQPFVHVQNTGTRSPSGSSPSIFGRKMSTRQAPSSSKASSLMGGDGPSARPRVHMEPRSPAGQRTGNDDLIDFIRQGPPDDGQPRIPRSVAPFRSTVDSDQFDRMLDENSNIESAYGGSQVSTMSKQSANSRTGLLPAANTVQPAYSNTAQKLTGSISSPEPQVQRTRRRVKDPYAIDLTDDEEDDLLTALPRPAQRKEESLMDFLNSTDPPPSNNPQPLLLDKETLAAAKARAASAASNHSASASISSATASQTGSTRRAPSVQQSIISTSISSDAPGVIPPRPRLQAKPAGAREAIVGRSGTSDLADFLRNSGPPEPRAPPVAEQRREQPKKSNARFWRKKNVEV
ncbi:uncharacterized protein EI97DRAFT_450048 [Westerdykella ornata]|uniref:Uncharacterized protein n=1 Tax=Westerdykella ornata TaxID=318751 RepID=A0A6A6JP66_WESOR|nr:uncharacterized protein EI97DRAFT_450048 [Westerdykella ornata]KAF2276739.1 hypothetical protein EI97DRAFT_450048 [Westerdykella ornata]